MQLKKSNIIISILTLVFFGLLIGVQYFIAPNYKIMDEENAIEARADFEKHKPIPPIPKVAELDSPPSSNSSSNSNIPSPSSEDEKLNQIQKEIATLSNSEIAKETTDLKSKLYEGDLINRLNSDQVTAKEREQAKDMLVRLALLGVEKAKRGLKEIEPEMEDALRKHEENMAELKDMLND